MFAPSTKFPDALFVVDATEQLSAVVALPNVTPLTAATHVPASTLTVTSAGAVIVGSILSTTVLHLFIDNSPVLRSGWINE